MCWKMFPILQCASFEKKPSEVGCEADAQDVVGRVLVVTDANGRGYRLPLCINPFFFPLCVFFLSELHHYGIICRMVLHIHVGFKNKTIIDAVQDVTQFYFALFYIYFLVSCTLQWV